MFILTPGGSAEMAHIFNVPGRMVMKRPVTHTIKHQIYQNECKTFLTIFNISLSGNPIS